MAKAQLRLVSPRSVNGTVPPKRRPNADLRSREHLTEAEVERLIKAAKANRHGQRDATMILIAYRHGLRAAELVDLRWDQVELGRNAVLHVRRVKNGMPSAHPLQGDEMRALRALPRDSTFVFTSERGAPFTRAGSPRWWRGWASRRASNSECIPTCCAMPAVMHWPTEGIIPGRSKPTSDIRTFSTRFDIPNCRP
jgi:integrase